MEKTKAIILGNRSKHSHFEEYFKIIDIIEQHENTNPDICIESCKALIEGVSKTILVNLDSTRTKEIIDKEDLPKLFSSLSTILGEKCEDIEGDFISRFGQIVKTIGEIRNKRSDISHGRMAPKFVYSSAKFSSTVKQMTDSILEYILTHYFSLEFPAEESNLKYYLEDLEDYNNWLDESVDFPIKKARYSKVLYDTDYDEYETRYYDDFLKEKEVGEEVEGKEDVAIEGENGLTIQEKIKQIILDGAEKLSKTNFDAEQRVGELLKEFAQKWKLDFDDLEELYNDYYFSEKPPLRDEIVNIMVTKPENLKERIEIVPIIIKEFLELAERLNILRIK
ncbi:MAG: hypothetical protein K0R65_1735 [Crocinitomicaceae bacterium]|jgi:hypothetical protein|nr:hypothetical protein [Crocinitomicaceae bacterium]